MGSAEASAANRRLVLREVAPNHGQVERSEDRLRGFTLEEEGEGAMDEVRRVGGGRVETGQVIATDAHRVVASAIVVGNPDIAGPAVTGGLAVDLDRCHALLPWQRGHQYVVLGISVGSGADRMSVPQRRHGRPERP